MILANPKHKLKRAVELLWWWRGWGGGAGGDGVGGGGGWRDIKLVEEHEEGERNEWRASAIVWAWKVYLEWVDGGGGGW